VPKFFDNVLAKRAGEAVSLKGMWWDARRDAAMEGIKEKEFKVGLGWGQQQESAAAEELAAGECSSRGRQQQGDAPAKEGSSRVEAREGL
jgi:hypothetical protein